MTKTLSLLQAQEWKTLTFWMLLLFCPAGHIQVVITPLNFLGRQNMELLEKAGMKAIFIGADMATSENFLISQTRKSEKIINPSLWLYAIESFKVPSCHLEPRTNGQHLEKAV